MRNNILSKQFFPLEMEEIEGILQEGIGEETGAAGFLNTQLKKEQPRTRRKIQGLESRKYCINRNFLSGIEGGFMNIGMNMNIIFF